MPRLLQAHTPKPPALEQRLATKTQELVVMALAVQECLSGMPGSFFSAEPSISLIQKSTSFWLASNMHMAAQCFSLYVW